VRPSRTNVERAQRPERKTLNPNKLAVKTAKVSCYRLVLAHSATFIILSFVIDSLKIENQNRLFGMAAMHVGFTFKHENMTAANKRRKPGETVLHHRMLRRGGATAPPLLLPLVMPLKPTTHPPHH